METVSTSTTPRGSVQRLEDLIDEVWVYLHSALADIESADDFLDSTSLEVADEIGQAVQDAKAAVQDAFDRVVDWQQDVDEDADGDDTDGTGMPTSKGWEVDVEPVA